MGSENFFTVEETARVLRIGRTAAYQAAKRFRQTGGAEGLPVIAVSGSLRVPRHQLELLAGGPVELPSAEDNVIDLTDRKPTTTSEPARRPIAANPPSTKASSPSPDPYDLQAIASANDQEP